MTPSSDMVEAGQRLASDLRRIRELRGVSIESMIERTKATPDILAAFEDNALVDHPLYNRVYLRSFVRMYAEALDVDREAALDAADQLLDGRYNGALGTRYLEDQPNAEGDSKHDIPDSTEEPLDGNPEEPVAGSQSDVGPADRIDETVDEKPEPDDASDFVPEEVAAEPDDEPEDASEVAVGPEVDTAGTDTDSEPDSESVPAAEVSSQTGGDSESDPAKASTVDSPEVESDDEAEASRGVDSAQPVATVPLPVGPPWMGRLLWAVPVVVVLALAAILLFGRSENPEPVSVPPTGPTPVEPLPPVRIDTTDTMRVEMPPRVVLGDTINLWVVAARDTLNPVRIQVDTDLRRPYWVELGDSTLVQFTDHVVVDRETGVLALGVAGYRIPASGFVPGAPITLNREQIQAVLDSLRMVQ